MGDVVEVQHRSGAENVHFGFLLLLPMRQVPAFSSFPFTWLSKTSIYMGQKITFYSLDIIFNIPTELKKKNFQKGKACNNENFCMELEEETHAI